MDLDWKVRNNEAPKMRLWPTARRHIDVCWWTVAMLFYIAKEFYGGTLEILRHRQVNRHLYTHIIILTFIPTFRLTIANSISLPFILDSILSFRVMSFIIWSFTVSLRLDSSRIPFHTSSHQNIFFRELCSLTNTAYILDKLRRSILPYAG